MKKTAQSFILISTLLFSAVAGIFVVRLGKANPSPIERYFETPIITVYSPTAGTYANDVLLNLTITRPKEWLTTPFNFSQDPVGGISQKLSSISYDVDGKYYGGIEANSDLSIPFNYTVNLPTLNDGNHRLSIIAHANGVTVDWVSDTVTSTDINSYATEIFHVDATAPTPTIYPTPTPSPTPEPTPMAETFPASLVFVASVGIALAVTGLLIHFKKSKPSVHANMCSCNGTVCSIGRVKRNSTHQINE